MTTICDRVQWPNPKDLFAGLEKTWGLWYSQLLPNEGLISSLTTLTTSFFPDLSLVRTPQSEKLKKRKRRKKRCCKYWKVRVGFSWKRQIEGLHFFITLIVNSFYGCLSFFFNFLFNHKHKSEKTYTKHSEAIDVKKEKICRANQRPS